MRLKVPMRVSRRSRKSLEGVARVIAGRPLFRTQSGSAAVEFVILAIPLFLPVIIYLTQFAEVSSGETRARSLVREVVRAYVASENQGDAEESANLVLSYGAQKLGFSPFEITTMKITFLCSSDPCMTAGGRVRGDLEFDLPITHRRVHVSAQEYVSPWQ